MLVLTLFSNQKSNYLFHMKLADKKFSCKFKKSLVNYPLKLNDSFNITEEQSHCIFEDKVSSLAEDNL